MINIEQHINNIETLRDMLKKEQAILDQYLEEYKKGMNIPQRKDIDKSFDEMIMRRNITRDKKTYI